MMKKWFITLFSFIFCVVTYAAVAPIPLLQSVSSQLISELKRNEATLKTKPQLVYNMVMRILVPHVDTESMARNALGRSTWQNATTAQQEQFTHLFTTLVVRTYSSALAEYTDEQVRFYPRHSTIGSDRAQVESEVIRAGGGQPISVRYFLVRAGSTWKLYDFSVDGISMVASFRSQFLEEIQKTGIDGLLRKLAEHNVQQN